MRETKNGRLKPVWFNDNKGGYLCRKCYCNVNKGRRNKLQRELRKRKKNQLLI